MKILNRSEELESLKYSISLSKQYYLYIEFRMFYLKYRREGRSVQDALCLALDEWDLL